MSCAGCQPGISLEQRCALLDVYNLMRERGAPIIFKLNTEDTVVRDRLNNIKQYNIGVVDVASGKITTCSTEQTFTGSRLERKATGLKEQTGISVRVPSYTFYNLGLNTDELEDMDMIRDEVIYRNSTYRIQEMQLDGQFGSIYLYILLTLTKK